MNLNGATRYSYKDHRLITMEFKDYYKILGVDPTATADEIKRAYKKLARRYHPDVSDEADAQEKFQDISNAYDNLKSDEKRSEYDQLRAYMESGGNRFRSQTDPNMSFDDLLSSIFGHTRGAFDGSYERSFDASFGFPQQPSYHNLEITLEESYRGSSRQLKIQNRSGDRTINVTIPEGITAGKQLRLAGQGEPGPDGLPSDLYLEVSFAPDPHFRVEGQHLYSEVELYPWDAALGCQKSINTLGGQVSLKIPENSQTGQKLRLKGRGLGEGDQYVVLRIVNPDVRTARSRDAFTRLREQFADSSQTA